MSTGGHRPFPVTPDAFDLVGVGSDPVVGDHDNFLLSLGCLNDPNFLYTEADLGVPLTADLLSFQDEQSRHRDGFPPIHSDEEIMDYLPPPVDVRLKEEQDAEPTYIVRREAVELGKRASALDFKIGIIDGKRTCPMKNCNESFKREYNARMHILHVHFNLRKYECSKCHWKSKRKYDMIRHLNTHRKKD